MFLYQSANLEYNLYRTCVPCHMHQDWKLSVGNRSMYIHISGWHTVDFGTLSCLIFTRWHRWHSRQRWHRLSWRWPCSVATPACLRILCCAIFARKAAVHLIFMNHSRVSFYCSLHLSMPRKLNSLRFFFLAFGVRLLDQVLCFLYCGPRKPSFGQLGHIQGKAHVGLF